MYLKALYIGRYQQTKEQGVKSRSQSMDSPKPDPLLVSTQNLARQARKFRTRAKVLPEGQRNRMRDCLECSEACHRCLPSVAVHERMAPHALENEPHRSGMISLKKICNNSESIYVW